MTDGDHKSNRHRGEDLDDRQSTGSRSRNRRPTTGDRRSYDDALEGQVVLGRYRILQPLARGGMGVVYLARIEGAAGFSKPVVVKRVLPHLDEQEASRQQFIREARILSHLQHPGIVGVIDFAETDDGYLMVLEYVHGYHLGRWLRYVVKQRGAMNWQLAALVLIRVLDALEYAHTYSRSDGKPLGIVHRDVSPGNVLIDLEGNVRLLDFGIAHAKGDTDEFKTEEGILKGKLPFIAPEVYGASRASPRSDVYACGVVLYQLLTGRNPFVGKSMSETVNLVLSHTPEAVSKVRSDIPPQLDSVVDLSLSKDPELRFQSADEMASALRELLPRPETEIRQHFKEVIRTDFSGDMPELLNLTSLTDLEAAWQASGSGELEGSLLRSSLPPPLESDATDLVKTTHHSSDQTESSPKRADDSDPTDLISALHTPNTGTAAPAQTGVSSKTFVLAIIGAAVVAGLAALAAVVLTRPEPTEKPSRFLVVERPSDRVTVSSNAPESEEKTPESSDPDEGTASDPAAEDPPGPPSETTIAAAPTVKQGATGKNPSGADDLSQAFARRQGAIQNCFARNAESLEGSPQVSVRFQVARDGQVEAASLSPQALSGTSLGQCILSVARSTKFGAHEKPVTFTIPITARAVKR